MSAGDVPGRIVVIGVGNPYRGDDGVGHRVLDLLEPDLADAASAVRPSRLHATDLVRTDGEPARLIELWRGADLAVVVDAVTAGGSPGSITVTEAGTQPLPTRAAASSHATGIAEAWALGGALESLPNRLLIVGVEPATFDDGAELSPAVAAAVPTAARLVRAAIAISANHPSGHVPGGAFVAPPRPSR